MLEVAIKAERFCDTHFSHDNKAHAVSKAEHLIIEFLKQIQCFLLNFLGDRINRYDLAAANSFEKSIEGFIPMPILMRVNVSSST